MILVDSSIWIDHLRAGDAGLASLLNRSAVLGHPFVTGELALGSLRNRATIIGLLQDLPQAPVASHDEVLAFVETERLFGLGIGYTDVHLLASARLAQGILWTRDKRLGDAATRLGLAFVA